MAQEKQYFVMITHENCAIQKITNNRYICQNENKTQFAIYEYTNFNKCCVCYNQLEVKKVIVPCGHTNLCDNCYKKINECPICKTPIQNFIRLYM